MYEEQGRIRVAFLEITAKKAETNDGVVVNITINEGPVYKLGTVALAGVPAAEVAQLAEIGRLAQGRDGQFHEGRGESRKDPPAPARARVICAPVPAWSAISTTRTTP